MSVKIQKALEHLAFVKYLYDLGIEQSERPEPFCQVSILILHDAIELFLGIAAEYLETSKLRKDIKFMEYFDLINEALKKLGKTGLDYKGPISRLNEARVALKHHGIIPSKTTIQDSKVNATNFFIENTSIVFDREFVGISLVDLIQCEASKKSLAEAKSLLEKKKNKEALERIAVAFAQLIDDYEGRKKDEWGRSPFSFGDSASSLDLPDSLGEVKDCIETTNASLEKVKDAMKILCFGIDYRKYVKFRLITPNLLRISTGNYNVQTFRKSRRTPSATDVQFCIDFVIESAVTLQEFDFEVERGKRPSLLDAFG